MIIAFAFLCYISFETKNANFLVPAFMLMAIDVGLAYVRAMGDINKKREDDNEKPLS